MMGLMTRVVQRIGEDNLIGQARPGESSRRPREAGWVISSVGFLKRKEI
jgi:hypothetical protein